MPAAEPQSPVIIPTAEPQSPVHRFLVFNRRNTPGASSSTPASTSSSSERPRRMRNLDELYDATQVMEDTTLFCFFAYKTKKNAKEEVQKYKAIEEGNIYQIEVHAWHDIPRLSLKGRFVEY